jgi:hypothetical protein
MKNLLTVVGLIVLLLFAGELSLAVGPVIGVGFAIVVLVATLLAVGWRRRSRNCATDLPVFRNDARTG